MQQVFFFDDEGRSLEIPNILDIAGLGTPPVRLRTSQGYRQHGATLHAAAYEPRAFTIAFDATGRTWGEAAAVRDAIASFFGRLTPKTMLYKRGSFELYLGDIWLANPYDTTAREVHVLSGKLQLIAMNPFFYKPIKPSAVALETPMLEYIDEDGGIEFDYTDGTGGLVYSTMEQSITVTNNGPCPETPAIIRFYAPADQPWVKNTTTGQTIKVTKELGPGEVLAVDSKAQTVRIIDASGIEHEAFTHISEDPDEFDFITLNPGENVFEFGSEGVDIGFIEVGGYEYYTHI